MCQIILYEEQVSNLMATVTDRQTRFLQTDEVLNIDRFMFI